MRLYFTSVCKTALQGQINLQIKLQINTLYAVVLRHPAESGKCDEGTELSYMTRTIKALIYGGPLSDSFGGGGHLFPD